MTYWNVEWLSEPGAPVSKWNFRSGELTEVPDPSASQAFIIEHKATGITGLGLTRTEAIESLINGLIEYANEFYSDLAFYLSPRSGRREHLPYVRTVKRYEKNRLFLSNLLTNSASGVKN